MRKIKQVVRLLIKPIWLWSNSALLSDSPKKVFKGGVFRKDGNKYVGEMGPELYYPKPS